jgi:CBS domain-containing protein
MGDHAASAARATWSFNDADRHVVGVISASDLGGKNGEALRARRRVRELMTEKLVTVNPETTVREAANLMLGTRWTVCRSSTAAIG